MAAPRAMIITLLSCLPLTLPGAGISGHAEPLGRLFTTPEQRAEIDAARYTVRPDPEPIVIPEPETLKPERNQISAPIRLRGMIRGGGGEPIYWINDSNSMQADFLQENITVLPDRAGSRQVEIRLPDDRVIPLQVGESYLPSAKDGPSERDGTTRDGGRNHQP